MSASYSIKLLMAGAFTAVIAGGSAFAQQKTSFSYTPGPDVAGKYLQRHALEVGDVPGHVIALSEIVTTYPADKPAPVIADVRMTEGRAILQADFTSSNGPVTGYRTFKMANGDKIFAKTSIGIAPSAMEARISARPRDHEVNSVKIARPITSGTQPPDGTLSRLAPR